MRIDSHQHFWRYSPDEFGWISDDMHVLQRDFLPYDLQPELQRAGIDKTIAVQARQSLSETTFLLELADNHDFVCGVVGWVPLADRAVESVLEPLAAHKRLVGVRHIVQDEPDDLYILGDDFNRGISLLRKYDLCYDILIFERHLPQTIRFVDRHPNQRFVVDHLAKPRVADGVLEPWRASMQRLAVRDNVYCKLSGLTTEANPDSWSIDDLTPYWEVALDTFGPSRLLFGSDWPVCRLATDYSRWYATVERLAAPLTLSEKASLFGKTAEAVYRIET